MQLIYSALGIMAPLLLASLGGLFSELSGTLNIALEGMMIIGAFTSILFADLSGSLLIGALLGIFFTIGLSSILAWITIKLKANAYIAALAANLLASGLVTVISGRVFGTEGVVSFSNLSWIDNWTFLILCFIATALVYLVLNLTPYGFHLRACGKNPEALQAIGLKPDFFRFSAFLISGGLCSLAGAAISFNLNAYVPNSTAGRGWIALVIIFLGNKKPFGLLLAAFVFALSDSFSNFAQGIWDVPSDFILALPYVITLIAMILFSIIESHRKSFE